MSRRPFLGPRQRRTCLPWLRVLASLGGVLRIFCCSALLHRNAFLLTCQPGISVCLFLPRASSSQLSSIPQRTEATVSPTLCSTYRGARQFPAILEKHILSFKNVSRKSQHEACSFSLRGTLIGIPKTIVELTRTACRRGNLGGGGMLSVNGKVPLPAPNKPGAD